MNITYNYDEYAEGIDVTDPEYKRTLNIQKSKELVRQLRDSLKEELNLKNQ
jgi:hypothetical protein